MLFRRGNGFFNQNLNRRILELGTDCGVNFFLSDSLKLFTK